MRRRSFLTALGALAAAPATPLGRASQVGRSADVLLRNGRICTGIGATLEPGGAALRGARIAAVGDLTGWTASREIDVAGQVIAPGFIDVHSHAAEGLARKGLHTARALLAQGITTVVVNPDGGGPLDLVAQQDAFLSLGIGVHVAQLVGHGVVRGAVLQMDNREPSAMELDRMGQHVDAGLAAGAVGLSSGLFYAPGHFARTSELEALMGRVAAVGGLHTSHIRDESNYSVGLVAAVDEIIRIAEASGSTGIVSHIKALGPDVWGLSRTCIRHIDEARARGVSVWADQYPYEASSTSLAAAVLPRTAQVGGREALLARLGDPAQRATLLPDVRENIRRRGGAASLVVAFYPPERSYEGLSLEAIAARRGAPPEEAALDVIATRDPSIVSFNMTMDDIDTLMTQPWMMTSSDGAIFFTGEGRPHPRGNGAFTRKLTAFVRDRQVIRLPEALQSMTRLPANVFGFTDRGRLEAGARADVVVFDLQRLEDRATYLDPHQLAGGMSFVFVDGVAAIDEGEFTDAVAGTVLRRGRGARTRGETRDEHWMALALEAARRVPDLPFGAVLVDEAADALRATGWNRGGTDPIGHGEIDVIQRLAAASPDEDWTRLTLYTTAEPCPLCASAVAWAGIPRVVYGVSIPWLVAHGWWQIDMRADELFTRVPDRPVALRGGVLESACAALFGAARAT